MKILRLSIANIKKHKLQAALLIILFMICMAVAGSALASWFDMKKIYPTVSDDIGIYKNLMFMKDNMYSDSVIDILRQDDRVTDTKHFDFLLSRNSKYIDTKGEEQAIDITIMTEDRIKKIEKLEIETTLSKEEINKIEHPVYLQHSGKDAFGFNEGDTFVIIVGTKKYSYTVAGFYEYIFTADTTYGHTLIVTDNDYKVLMGVIDKYDAVAYNVDPLEEDQEISDQFLDRYEEYISKDVGDVYIYEYNSLIHSSMIFVNVIIYIMIFLAVVVLVAALIMIRFRITGDIQDQIQTIGVLEALGYKSREISLAYTAEYLIMATLGIMGGFVVSPLLIILLHSVGEQLSGHHGVCTIEIIPILFVALVLFIFVGIIAYIRSGMVKKFPPVYAFRKGISSHHFGKNPLPLRNTRGNIHIRMAMKGFLQNIRGNIGITVCIAVTTIAVVISAITANIFGSDIDAAMKMVGLEDSDYLISLVGYADADEVAEGIREIPGVRKVLVCVSAASAQEVLKGCDEELYPVAYKDYSLCENLYVVAGKFPEHENEVMVSTTFAGRNGLKVGDNLTLEYNETKKNYVVSGTINCVASGGNQVYITLDGLSRMSPKIRPHSMEIYLEEGLDKEEFLSTLLKKYGKNIADTSSSETGGDTTQERIESIAQQRIAKLMDEKGLSHAEYSVQIGDIVISGTSDDFVIRNITSMRENLTASLGGLFQTIGLSAWIFMAITLIVVFIIISILMEQNIRRERRNLGVMLSMGYTTKELMLQSTLKIMPSVLIAVITGTIVGSASIFAFFGMAFGQFDIDIKVHMVSAIVMILFSFGSAYFGSSKIKKISVTELMTE